MTVGFCSLASGSSGNCHLINDGKKFLLIDAGLSGKQIENKLKEVDVDPQNLSAILVSHEHSDHICGVGILSRRYNIPIYANDGTWAGMERKIGNIKKENIKCFTSNENFSIGDFNIKPYRISHDANEPVGFSIEKDSIKISIATDLGYISEDIMEEIGGSNLVILESNHDEEMLKAGSYPYSLKRRILSNSGHLSNEAAGNAIVDLVSRNVRSILLAHLSRENNFPELAIATVKNILDSKKIIIGKDIELDLVHRDRVSNIYQF
ncbi:MBL fold metallo-hydrolase [Alkaliphilus sp. MSJ-5]|uniref:MBL fold metallo-hydrolase n=1 Tax=Alkaliphilus flagellatus TaxID=2841507 RepID=A0ABS6G4T0_9FIRM|nr:MBL fold metallo-hydrolase [Alkaliphilus flagellatus]MBU5676366.1 MBL fold metallo-hydrolase [Alkaliphilus flagellatus]